MSVEAFFAGADLVLEVIERAQINRLNETELFLELNKPKYDRLTEAQRLKIVELFTDNKLSDAQKAVDDILSKAPD